ncbi:hypothetical protein D9758_009614 [Tetrapyrgos nigripes]|uniref:DUF6534 domain-containing protein n=1 Tax=Tetrapyrgos nigripes TaxID=182062 RepID=A0A8H5LMI4_9AGAR|nr:hypothetical protein D9758_009614 [Tetrapyrgos nigripes]
MRAPTRRNLHQLPMTRAGASRESTRAEPRLKNQLDSSASRNRVAPLTTLDQSPAASYLPLGALAHIPLYPCVLKEPFLSYINHLKRLLFQCGAYRRFHNCHVIRTYDPSSERSCLQTLLILANFEHQTFNYFHIYPKDDRGVKALVWVIWILDSLHVALCTSQPNLIRTLPEVHFYAACFCIYHYLVTNYMNPARLADSHWSLNVNHYAAEPPHRSYRAKFLFAASFRLSPYDSVSSGLLRWFLVTVLSISVLAHFVFGMVTVAFLFIYPDFIEFQESHLVRLSGATPFAIFAVLSDIFIAGSLCYLLYENRTGFRDTNTIITTLIIYAVNRCLLTSVVAITEVIVFVLTPRTLWFLAIDFVIGKLYANSLLASLNSRRAIRGTPRGTSYSTSFSVATPDGHTSLNFASNVSGANAEITRGRVVALDSLNDVELGDRQDRFVDEYPDTSTKRNEMFKFLPSTPSNQWADETLDAAHFNADRVVTSSTTSTPGFELPGAFPRDYRGQSAVSSDTDAPSVVERAKQYIPAQGDVEQVLKSVGETAKQYLPQSLTSYFPGGSQPNTSLPSQENELTRSDGIGSLPGNASESAVALLPDERNAPKDQPKTSLPSQENELTRSDGAGSLPGNASESAVALLPDERNSPQDSDGKLLDTSALTPSTNRDHDTHNSISNISTLAQDGSEYGKSTPGLGLTPTLSPSLSSNTANTNVTASTHGGGVEDPSGGSEAPKLAGNASGQEFKEKQEPLSSEGPALNLAPRTHPLAHTGAEWKGVPLDEEYQRKNLDGDSIPSASSLEVGEKEKKFELGSARDEPSTTSESTLPLPNNDSKESGQHISKIASVAAPSQVSDTSSNTSATQSRFTEQDSTNVSGSVIPSHRKGASIGSRGSLEGSQGTAGSTGSIGRKSKLLNKIKGEVKVISGKLGGKEEKVEEGRRLMRGDV